ncbi:TonB-dependent receptor plug domain-containing protein [Chitinophaga tropicalis]|uniref:TonB-dependent receptor n=1 Tax=Chitinophaga tropicalis TaxID=2683588 RepID=A0A7K1U316_9BACT|nr:TonB-dependent receptor [Chitinophaga tropicalis]MVT08749.1 TonB-dependent receptor [Chitinophaga tropicalis]
MKYLLLVLTSLLTGMTELMGQHAEHKDSIANQQLKEVVVIGQLSTNKAKTMRVLSSLDNYLDESVSIDMVKRGAYAWEPMLNGMTTERSVITIDGMRIYGACTDKMDPVTSYVDITNLSQAKISHGQAGAASGATIAGSIDFMRKKSGFDKEPLAGNIFTGLESSNMQKITGASIHHSANRFFSDLDFIYRDAGNYKTGGGEEVPWSQFTKYNLSATTGYKLDSSRHIETSLIFDKATNVGYPALPMDVSLAQALIASLSYYYHPVKSIISEWETKIYYNTVKHIMDDSKRPDVPIRMDMPGWTKTTGFYSKINGRFGRHSWNTGVSAHINSSLAEMTMFSDTPGEKDMFMLTWPDVNTVYGNLFVEDRLQWSAAWYSEFSGGLGFQRNTVRSEFGLSSLRIFYPAMDKGKNRFLPAWSFSINRKTISWLHTLRIGYGERAPSVSEGYGFYLFNSANRFDYIGNPFLENERSLEAGLSSNYRSSRLTVKMQANYFHILDYIIGRVDAEFAPMTIGAQGVKVYEQLSAADILSLGLEANYRLGEMFEANTGFSYKFGRSKQGDKLPMMQPFSYLLGVIFRKQTFTAEANVQGSAAYADYSPAFGETPAAAYYTVNASLGKSFSFSGQRLRLKTGVENLLDRNYTTFADWNRIPRMGRNIFVNVIYSF